MHPEPTSIPTTSTLLEPSKTGSLLGKFVPLLLTLYVASLGWMGYLSADEGLVASFEGPKTWLLVIGLMCFYALPTMVSLWLITLLFTVTYKLASPVPINPRAVRSQGRILLVALFFCHATAFYVLHFTSTMWGATSFVVGLAVVTIAVARDRVLQGAKRFIAPIPLYTYAVADLALVAAST